MGKKIKWTRNFSEQYLVDRAFNQLSFAEHGMLKIATDLLWTQTDEPGKYIINGRPGTQDELIADLKRYATGSRASHKRDNSRAIARLLSGRGLAIDKDGIIVSPFILSELETSHLQQLRGEQGGNPGLSGKNNRDKRGVNPTEQDSTEQNNTTTVIIRQEAPPATAYPLADYEREVLNKCVGRNPMAEHPKAGLLLLIARHVPQEYVMEALSATQDARNNNLNPDAKHIKDLERYYFGTIKRMCREHNIETPIKWGKS